MAIVRLLLLILLCAACAAAEESTRSMPFEAKTPVEAVKWQAAAREKLFVLMMGGKRPEPVPLDPEILRRIEVPRASYVLEEITIQTLPDRRAHAWVAMPRSPKGKVPAVLALHGHGGSGEQIVFGISLKVTPGRRVTVTVSLNPT